MSQYKISKKRLAEIIKEEYQSLQHRKTRRLTEDASDDTFDMVDVIVQALGPQQALEELVQAMERSNAQDLLSYVMRMHDMRMPGDEVEDYDPSAFNRTDEELKGGQKELDKDKDGDIDAEDMAALRAKKKVKKESVDSIRNLIQQELQKL
jgi:threonine dehydrogenase-like Zn-dependent dehydrogenase